MIYLAIWLLCGLAAAAIGQRKGEGCTAFFVGMLLGPFGILLALMSTGNRRKCPHCAELVALEAKVCRHCQRDINAPPPAG